MKNSVNNHKSVNVNSEVYYYEQFVKTFNIKECEDAIVSTTMVWINNENLTNSFLFDNFPRFTGIRKIDSSFFSCTHYVFYCLEDGSILYVLFNGEYIDSICHMVQRVEEDKLLNYAKYRSSIEEIVSIDENSEVNPFMSRMTYSYHSTKENSFYRLEYKYVDNKICVCRYFEIQQSDIEFPIGIIDIQDMP